jgi:hypothetical protein
MGGYIKNIVFVLQQITLILAAIQGKWKIKEK